MSRTTIPDFAFTTGSKPDWESDIDYGDLLRPVSRSCVVSQSLRQSRERWLSDTFPRFSFKTRGKNNDPQPPPYVLYPRGNCDLKIGPHLFHDTAFYEAHYKAFQSTQATGQSSSTWQTNASTSSGTTSYLDSASLAAAPALGQAVKSSTNTTTSASLDSSTINQELITKVNEAAATNPTLASLLQQAAAGSATPEQLKTLGVLIQQLASPPGPPAPSVHPASKQFTSSTPIVITTPPPIPVQDFDLVIEFRERPQEKWLFPRALVTIIVNSNLSEGEYDTVVAAQVPFDTSAITWLLATSQIELEANSEKVTNTKKQVVYFGLRQPPAALRDTLNRWAGCEKKQKENQETLNQTPRSERVFLAHTLPQSDLLVALQQASQPSYMMKSLKPGTATKSRPKRRPPSKPKDSVPILEGGAEAGQESAPSNKRRRMAEVDKSPPVPIHCLHCKKTDVPLMQGGRYCRVCVEAGHAAIQASKSSTPVPQHSSDANIPDTSDTITNNP